MAKPVFQKLDGYPDRDGADLVDRSDAFLAMMKTRRTVRHFSDRPVPKAVIENAIRVGASAPSGANKQPWHFVAIAQPDLKRRLRIAAEKEERAFYGGKAGDAWLADLEQFGTDDKKPFLETAPWLIAVFKQLYGRDDHGQKSTHYYLNESVGLAAGFFLAALHQAGLATLTHTPSPMGFLNDLCQRPASEKPIMLVVAGYPAPGAEVPVIDKKPFKDVATVLE